MLPLSFSSAEVESMGMINRTGSRLSKSCAGGRRGGKDDKLPRVMLVLCGSRAISRFQLS